MICYHSTNKENAESILNNNFRIPNTNYGRFGHAVYFSNVPQTTFGNTTLKCTICDNKILCISHADLCNLFNTKDYTYQIDEEGIPQVENYALENGFSGVYVSYSDGEKELALYNLESILSVEILK